MIESVVIDSALKIIDKLTELLKFRHEKRREYFTTILEPMFSDLSVVHANYLKMFQSCSAQLNDESTPLRDIGKQLAQQRVEYEAVRIKIESFVVALCRPNKLPDPYQEFLLSVVFSMPDGRLRSPYRASFATGIMWLLENPTGPEFTLSLSGENAEPDVELDERANALEAVGATSKFLKARWAETCQKFAAAQAFSLT
jgi:hypothetical protein